MMKDEGVRPCMQDLWSRRPRTLADAGYMLAGGVLFFPVGVQYLVLLWAMAAWAMQRRRYSLPVSAAQGIAWERWAVGLLVWTALVMVWQDRFFPQTVSHGFHVVRIVCTLWLFHHWSPSAARHALHGVWLGLAGIMLALVCHHAGWWSMPDYGIHLVTVGTNKTIGASVLMGMMAVWSYAWLISRSNAVTRWLALSVLVVLLITILLGLGKRTAAVGCLLGALTVSVHHWRYNTVRLWRSVVWTAGFAATAWILLPSVRHSWLQGWHEVTAALQGEVSVESWNVRVQMLRHTVDMVIEKPWLGWGVGAWNTEWALRVDPALANFNMPHNDLLWLGSETGVLGAILWMGLMLAPLSALWRVRNWRASAASGVVVFAFAAAMVNNATRDATIGLSMLMLVGWSCALAYGHGSTGPRSPGCVLPGSRGPQ